ncbi:MAG: hypothetical protein RLZZ175_1076 [Bacteroidota bacterium]|jgi:hypothetical protein
MKAKLLSLMLFFVVLTSLKAQTTVPYLEVMTPNSVFINWKTSSGTESKVLYGKSSSNLNLTTTGTNNIWTDAGYSNNYYYHSVHLTGLQPYTKYYYKVQTGAYVSPVYSFRTMPSPGGAEVSNKKMRFLIMGDNQLKNEPRYDSLVIRAKRKVEAKYGVPLNEAVDMVVMVGDQVDVGTLDHYENVHFNKIKAISPYIGISTIVGNHETYGSLNLTAYKNHFHYDGINYKGINSGTEEYYAFLAGNVLFMNFTTEGSSTLNAAQYTWGAKVLDSANVDPNVKWIVSLAHRPYQAEQYIGDVSTWIRNTMYPKLITSSKYLMNVGAHHHLYARGQDKNKPVYNIISGGSAWDQYWGMSTEADYDDCQKTICNWNYQIMEVDLVTNAVNIESYSIGYTTSINDWTNTTTKFVWEESRLIDQFYRKTGQASPATPSFTNTFPSSTTLPFTLVSSTYSTTTSEPYNSTQFQISQTNSFSTLEKDILRDYENLFGKDGVVYKTKDIGAGVDIFKYTINSGEIPNGTHYVRVRHRDRNMNWSAWSTVQTLVITGSTVSTPKIVTDKIEYINSESIQVTYTNGSGNLKDWIGIYKKGQTPGSGTTSTTWKYVTGASGVLNFTVSTAGEYYIAYFSNDGYTELATRINIYVGSIPVLTSNKNTYKNKDTVQINYSNAPANAKDWIGIYRVGKTPGASSPADKWSYTTGTNGTLKFTGLTKGYYYAQYLLTDGYTGVGNKLYFSYGDTIATIKTDKIEYNLGDLISVDFQDGPGVAKDWLGIFNKNANPNIDPLINYAYVGGLPKGTATFQADNVPKLDGEYFVVFFTNDSYNEISNRVYFKIKSILTNLDNDLIENPDLIKLYPNPSNDGKVSIAQSKYPIDKINIYDFSGNLIFAKEKTSTETSVMINHSLPPGVYTVEVISEKIHRLKMVVTEE